MRKILSASFFLMMIAQPVHADEGSAEKVNQGLENVKQGTKQAAEGIKGAAEEAGAKASTVGKSVGRALKAATCPIVGDRSTKLYYAKDSKSYASILDGQKYFEDDDRACFLSEEAARNEGYRRDSN